MSQLQTHLEFLGEDPANPKSKIWKVEAIHVTTTGNKRKFTKSELQLGARSLSFRPININHEEDRKLPQPENQTLDFHFDESKMAVVGRIQITDRLTNSLIEGASLDRVSIEQIPTKGENCNELLCEQNGVTFVGIALLERGVQPGDPQAHIIRNNESISKSCDIVSNLIISDEQRKCPHCTDFVPCSNCSLSSESESQPKMETSNEKLLRNTETDGDCPPGQTWDAEHSKCVKSGETAKEQAGDSADKGAGTNVNADDKSIPSDTHDCPPGTSWNADIGACEETGDPAGDAGGGGTGAPSATGKESIETILEAQQRKFEAYLSKMGEWSTKQQRKLLEQFTKAQEKQLTKQGVNTESVAFGVPLSSKVDLSGAKSVYTESVRNPANWFEAARTGAVAKDSMMWTIEPQAYLESLPHYLINYGSIHANTPINQSNIKSEAFTITGGDMPQVFSKQVYLIPGGRMRVPIRQFLDTQIITDSDRFNWYKVNGFDFDDTTAEGTEPTNEAQTITKVTATPSLKRAVQTVNYSDIENAPFDLIEAFNRAAALGALAAEATEVLDTTYNAITPSNWVNGNTGGVIASDDVAGMTLKQEGIYAAKRLIETQGGDTSPGNLVLFAHPKAVEELVLDTAADFFTGQNALHSTALGVLENRLGMDIVVTNSVAAQDNATNDTYRNVLATKGSIGLSVAADLQIEAQRRPDLSAVKVGARHRIRGAVIDETVTCRVSSAQ